jgi:flagellin-like hook-associated protein FlgL
MIVDDSIAKMSDGLAKLYDLQKKASTGKKYLNASDDPSNAANVFTLKSTLQISQVYETTTQNSNDWMEASDFAMQHASDLDFRIRWDLKAAKPLPLKLTDC